MVGTLPGRTHGLGLITEPLMKDLQLDRVTFAAINLWATLLGSLFCIPVGWLIDRLGIRPVLSAVALTLGAVVVAICGIGSGGEAWKLPSIDVFASDAPPQVPVPADLFLLVLLTRGLGQSALSVVSLALVGKVGGRASGPVIGVYSFLVSAGFMAAFGAIKAFAVAPEEWRTLWAGIGWTLVAFGVLAALLPVAPASRLTGAKSESQGYGHSLFDALRTPAFWLFALATSFYGLVAAGVSLFNQSILEERGFDRNLFMTVTMLAPMIGLAANLATGWLATRFRIARLMTVAMAVLAGAMFSFPSVKETWHVYAYAAAMGIAGGMVTVLFFAVWGQAFGPRNLGQIQGAAQLLTVLASAAGPLLLATAKQAHGSYGPIFRDFAYVALGFGFLGWFIRVPTPKSAPLPASPRPDA